MASGSDSRRSWKGGELPSLVQVCLAGKNREGTKLAYVHSQLCSVTVKPFNGRTVRNKVLFCRKLAFNRHFFKKELQNLRHLLAPLKYI